MKTLNIAAVIMAKNEEKRISITLESVKDSIVSVILYDTGSQDSTIQTVKDFCQKHKLELHLLQGVFEDFATSRNKMLHFADQLSIHRKYHYYLLLDSNDEYKGPNTLNKVLLNIIEQKNIIHKIEENLTNANICNKHTQKRKQNLKINWPTAFIVHQKWFTGTDTDIDYYNIKIIKPNTNFKYNGCVHEYIVEPPNSVVEKLPDDIILYQDRVADNDGKTKSRWDKDVMLLKEALIKDPNDARSQYYLAQTFSCLGDKQQALYYYKIRSQNINGFYEERFISMMRCGYACNNNKNFKAANWFLQAFQLIARAEPLVELAKMCRLKNMFQLAYLFAKTACELKFPDNCLLWVDRKVYSHTRWQELGISAYYVKAYEEGKNACQKALESGFDTELNTNNLKWYIDRKLPKQ